MIYTRERKKKVLDNRNKYDGHDKTLDRDETTYK